MWTDADPNAGGLSARAPGAPECPRLMSSLLSKGLTALPRYQHLPEATIALQAKSGRLSKTRISPQVRVPHPLRLRRGVGVREAHPL